LLYRLIETAKANGLEPYSYLRHIFGRLLYAPRPWKTTRPSCHGTAAKYYHQMPARVGLSKRLRDKKCLDVFRTSILDRSLSILLRRRMCKNTMAKILVEIPDKLMADIDSLKEKLQLRSRSEIFRMALGLLDVISEHTMNNYEVELISKEKCDRKQLIMPML